MTGLTVLAGVRARLLELKQNLGTAEASVLDTLKNAANNALLEGLTDIQAGRPLARNGVSVEPVLVEADLTWSPTPTQLRDMGYLPRGWAAEASSLNQAPYRISFHRVPTGCVGAACAVEGQLVVMGPIRDGSGPDAPADGVLIGPILTRLGADGGVSLGTSRDRLTGFDNTWQAPNPVPGQPDGVVAVRLGNGSAGFGQFVRMGDTRDPRLAGNLSTAGHLAVGGGSTLTGLAELQAGATSAGPILLKDAEGNDCVQLRPDGRVELGCSSTLAARQAVFSDGTPSRSTSVGPGELSATGKVSANEVVASKSLSGERLVLADAVEGAACGGEATAAPGSAYAGLSGGGLALCSGGRWVAMQRLRTAGSACAATEEGALATDPADRQGLICRRGVYWRSAALLSDFVLVQTLDIQVATQPVVVAKPQCPSAAGTTEPEALIILTPNNEDAAAEGSGIVSGINRFAVDNGSTWTVHLERSSDGAVLPGTLIALVYCLYR